MDTVFIRDLRIPTVVGIYEWERRIRQEIRLDIEMAFDTRKAGQSDDINDTLDYKAVAKQVDRFVRDASFQLVEKLAEEICALIFREFPVAAIKLTLNKAGAVSIARDVGVVIERQRR